ncbi:STAS domain-containing protein [Neptunomonas sp. XY-337]|uniref:STAS domain-containing protein n=1 Tax=Neptunomonas sp. XY-337 TaxID=2561897 RepID=UPI0010AA6A05|nr:STAS domain-containing protein [Neptunomonas sp. XY-337]
MDNANTLQLAGPLTFDVIEARRQTAESFIKGAEGEVVIDLSSVERVDSSALSLCLCCSRLGQVSGKTVTFQHIPEDMLAMSKLVGLALF